MPFCQETCFLSAKLFASRCCWPKISRGVYLAPTVFQINFFHIFTHKKESLASNWKAGGGDIQGTGSPLPPPHWAGPLAPYASVVPASVGQAIVPALDRQCGFWASMISCPSVPPALMSFITRSSVCSFSSFNSLKITFLCFPIELSGLGSVPDWILFCSFYPPLKNVSNGWLLSCFQPTLSVRTTRKVKGSIYIYIYMFF